MFLKALAAGAVMLLIKMALPHSDIITLSTIINWAVIGPHSMVTNWNYMVFNKRWLEYWLIIEWFFSIRFEASWAWPDLSVVSR